MKRKEKIEEELLLIRVGEMLADKELVASFKRRIKSYKGPFGTISFVEPGLTPLNDKSHPQSVE